VWPNWEGETVVCIASGPSLTQLDVDYVRGKARVIVVNDNYRRAPWADLLYACDSEWWDHNNPEFTGLKVTQSKAAAQRHACMHVPGAEGKGLSTDPARINWNSNSGSQALNVAYHCASRRVLLLGYDFEAGPKGISHWFGEHPKEIRRTLPYRQFLWKFSHIAKQAPRIGLEIINCSRRTAIRGVQRILITEAL